MGQQTAQSHDLTRIPSARAVAPGRRHRGVFGPVRLRHRHPVAPCADLSSSNGIVVSADPWPNEPEGIVPLALTFDTGGPSPQRFTTVAVALSVD